MKPLRTLLVQAKDEQLLAASSSGGVFTLLAERMIAAGGIVIGAAFDEDGVVRHRAVETREGLAALRKSKYVRSDVQPGMKALEQAMGNGRKVLFTGTPCQVAAARKRFPHDRFPGLVTVDVLCHGAPDASIFAAYRAERAERAASTVTGYDWRDKTDGWSPLKSRVTFADGKSVLEPMNGYFLAFQHLYSLPEGCGKCPWMRPEREGDITLGDAWGLMRHWFDQRDNRGVSLVLVNTSSGADFFESLDAKLLRVKKVAFAEALRKQDVLRGPTPPPPERDIFVSVFRERGSFTAALEATLVAAKQRAAGRKGEIDAELTRLNRNWWTRMVSRKTRKRLRRELGELAELNDFAEGGTNG